MAFCYDIPFDIYSKKEIKRAENHLFAHTHEIGIECRTFHEQHVECGWATAAAAATKKKGKKK